MAHLDERIDDVVFLVDTITSGDESAFRVRSPDVQGLGVIESSLKDAIEQATEVATALRKAHGITAPFNVVLEVR